MASHHDIHHHAGHHTEGAKPFFNDMYEAEPEHHDPNMDVVEQGTHEVHSSKKEIWKIFFVLLAITALEFLIALTPAIKEPLGNTVVVLIFLLLTVAKAFYIVSYFMHLKHERVNMAYTILIPLLFLLYLVTLLMFEGRATML